MPIIKQSTFNEVIRLLVGSLDQIVDGTFSERVWAKNSVQRAIELLSGKKLNELKTS